MSDFLDPADTTAFRRVMGRFPTGLTVVTTEVDGRRFGLTCQAFTSVSLEPPLVGLFLASDSGTLWGIRQSKRFCINILSEDQVETARIFALSGADKFRGVETSDSPNGSPMLSDTVAWIDCDLSGEFEAGDHVALLGLVTGVLAGVDTPPVLYFRGGYGTFHS